MNQIVNVEKKKKSQVWSFFLWFIQITIKIKIKFERWKKLKDDELKIIFKLK